jgi:uncharacterized membrane protein
VNREPLEAARRYVADSDRQVARQPRARTAGELAARAEVRALRRALRSVVQHLDEMTAEVERLRDEAGEPLCTCAEDRDGGDPDDHAATCPWALAQPRR